MDALFKLNRFNSDHDIATISGGGRGAEYDHVKVKVLLDLFGLLKT
jgi:hypothetical protein